MRPKPIRQQVVAIVGAASGIGREIARRFAFSGTRLVIVDNDEVGLRSLADEITLAGGAEHPQRDIVVGGAGKMLLSTQRLSPPILDAILARIGYAAQHTSERRGPDAPNNLFGPVNQYNRAEGKFTDKFFPHSLATWLDLHPTAKAAATVGAAAGLGVLLSRVSERSGQPAASGRQPAGSTGNRR